MPRARCTTAAFRPANKALAVRKLIHRAEVRGARETRDMNTYNLWLTALIAVALAVFGGELRAQQSMPEETDNVVVYDSIAVSVNKSLVIRLPRRAIRVSVTQPQIAEALVVAPDQILINGKAIGSTSLVVWFAEK